MSVDQLDKFITQMSESENQSSSSIQARSFAGPIGTWLKAKAAWLAAATIADKRGYTCSATLVKASVFNQPYSEWSRGEGLFASKIRYNYDYLRAKRRHASSIEFTKARGADLFYALHKVSVNYHYSRHHPTHIHDVFDFDKLWQYGGLAGIANNIGYLSQHAHVLNPIEVNIYF